MMAAFARSPTLPYLVLAVSDRQTSLTSSIFLDDSVQEIGIALGKLNYNTAG